MPGMVFGQKAFENALLFRNCERRIIKDDQPVRVLLKKLEKCISYSCRRVVWQLDPHMVEKAQDAPIMVSRSLQLIQQMI